MYNKNNFQDFIKLYPENKYMKYTNPPLVIKKNRE